MASSIRVLHLGKYFPPVRGGIEQVTFDLAEGMAAAGGAVKVLCFGSGMTTSVERFPQYEVTRAGTMGVLASQPLSLAMFLQLKKALQAHSDTIVHLHVPNPLAMAFLLLLPKFPRTVVHWHSDLNHHRGAALVSSLEQKLLSKAEAIITTSPDYGGHSTSLARWRGKLKIVPIGILDRFKQQIDRGAKVGGDKVLLGVGRLVEYKGFGFLLEALAMLPEHYRLRLVGQGPMEARLRAQAQELKLTSRVDLLGNLSEQELQQEYQNCDVFCLPSVTRAEAFGVVLLEAMSAGKPLISTRIEGSGTGWVNLDGVTGFTVPPRDARAIASAATKIIETPDLSKQMGGAARARYLAEFTADRMVQRALEIYGQLSSSPRSSSHAATNVRGEA